MAASAQATQSESKYSVHTEAASLFKFLTGTFSQMPRSVQVVGWFAFLLLFVYLVLYPIVGITYYEGMIVQRSLDHNTGKPIPPTPVPGIKVWHDNTVVTNAEGEFTFAGRWPYIPFTYVDFWLEDPGVLKEEVSIPTPRPLISLFTPNRQKIFYVPSSTETRADGAPVHFFLDAKSARNALDKSSHANIPQFNPGPSAALLPGKQLSLLPIVYAATSNSTERNFALRLREIKLSGISFEAQVYFDIRLDGQPLRSSSLPDANSSESRDLTVSAETPLRFDSLYFPVPEHVRRVDISMIERKSILQRDPLIGTVSLAVDTNKTGIYPALRGGNLEMTLELLPPASLRCLAVPGKQKNYIAAMWLDIAEQHLGDVTKLQYDRGADWAESRYASSWDTSSGLDPFNHYADMVSIFASQPVRASVTFAGGSKISLATFCYAGSSAAGTPMDAYYRAKAYVGAGEYVTALRTIDDAFPPSSPLAPPHSLKAGILANLGKFSDAEAEFKRAVELAPDSQATLNGYAWMLADEVPSPSRSQLLQAKILAEHSVRLLPHPGNYDTLGWAEFKLHENDQALQDLLSAERLCVDSCRPSTNWQEIEFHLGNVYADLNKKREAKQAFRAVLKYQQEVPELSKDKYVQLAKVSLGAT